MKDFDNNPQDMTKKVSRRNLLRNAAITATSAFLLLSFLSGCRKDTTPPGGGVGAEPDKSYYMKVNYTTTKGVSEVGYLTKVGANASTPYYSEFLVISQMANGAKFKLYPAPDGEGWQYLATDDGLWLSLSYDGYLYRANQGNRVAWKIDGGKLYSSYSRWKGYPAGSDYFSNPFNVIGYYAGVNFGNSKDFTNVELVRAP